MVYFSFDNTMEEPRMAAAIVYEFFREFYSNPEITYISLDSATHYDYYKENDILVLIRGLIDKEELDFIKNARIQVYVVNTNIKKEIECRSDCRYIINEGENLIANAYNLVTDNLIGVVTNDIIKYFMDDSIVGDAHTDARAFRTGFKLRGNISWITFFKDIVRKKEYSIFSPDDYVLKRLNGFAKHCVDDGHIALSTVDKVYNDYLDCSSLMYILSDNSTNQQYRVFAICAPSDMYDYDRLVKYINIYDIVYLYCYSGKWEYSFYTKRNLDLSKYMKLITKTNRQNGHCPPAPLRDSCMYGNVISDEAPLNVHQGKTYKVKNGRRPRIIIKN